MTIQVQFAHTIKLSYSGYGKYTATWKGYNKGNYHCHMRKTINVDSSYQTEKAGLEASNLFAQYLTDNASPEWTHNTAIVTGVTMGELGPDKRVVLVTLDWVKGSIQ